MQGYAVWHFKLFLAESLANAFANDRPQLQATFKNWMLASDTKAAFIAKLLRPDFLALIDQVDGHSKVPFALMVEAVFDHLSH